MRFHLALALTALLLLPCRGAHADRLDKEACEALKAEHARLLGEGAKADMERGPEWAKANLAPDRLQRIARLLEVEEGLAFRCPQPRPAPIEVEAKSAPGASSVKKTEEGSEKKAKQKAAEPANAVTAPKPKRAAAKEGPGAEATRAEEAATPAASAKSASKRKAQKPAADDAYSPPPGTGSSLKLPGDADAVPWKKE